MNPPELAPQAGFTLAELAVAFFIIAILLAGALIPLSTQMEVRAISDTRRTMDQINDALVGFVQSTGRLPCPAGPTETVAANPTTVGTEKYSGASCSILVGVIPWSTLGVPETDAWGRRFTYRVASVFSDAISANTFNTSSPASQAGSLDCSAPTPAPTLSSFALCSLGEIAVMTRSMTSAGVHNSAVLGSGLAAVFISHGRNGYGAYQTSGIAVSGLTANTDEATNAAGTTTGSPGGGAGNFTSYLFYSRLPTPYNSDCSETAASKAFCEFDDIVYMIPAATLAARMVAAGKLP